MISIFTDGGSRGNPGPAACAFVIYNGQAIIQEHSKFLGETTNNVAEYEGVVLALSFLKTSEIKKYPICFYLDSELVVKQINGVYKIKDSKMNELNKKIKSLLEELQITVEFQNVPREKNKKADSLVNEVLDRN